MSMEKQGPTEISAMELNALLRNTGKPVLVYIWAAWCPPCKTMSPQIAKAEALLDGAVAVVKLNAAADPQALTALNIVTVPSLILFNEHGEESRRTLGMLLAHRVVSWVQAAGLAEPNS